MTVLLPIAMKEFYKYFIVGIAAAVLDVSTFTIIAWGGVNHLLANVISTCVGLVFNYYFSCTWVFRQKKVNVKRDFVPFAAIGFLGMGLQCALLYLLIDLKLAVWSMNIAAGWVGLSVDMKPVLFLSKVFVTGVTFLWNFFLRKYLVFRRAEKNDAAAELSQDVVEHNNPNDNNVAVLTEQ